MRNVKQISILIPLGRYVVGHPKQKNHEFIFWQHVAIRFRVLCEACH